MQPRRNTAKRSVPVTTAGIVAGLFFPTLAELGLRVEATISPRLEKKLVYAGANSASFAQARRDLEHLADVKVSSERIRRATLRHGQIRGAVKEHLEKAYLDKTIPQQNAEKPADVEPPPIAVVMCDGGKYQRLDRGHKQPKPDSHWKESRVACLLSMTAADYGSRDEELPDFLQDVRFAKTLAEIGHVQGENGSRESASQEAADPPWQRGEMLRKEVIASSCSWKDFGVKVASPLWSSLSPGPLSRYAAS